MRASGFFLVLLFHECGRNALYKEFFALPALESSDCSGQLTDSSLQYDPSPCTPEVVGPGPVTRSRTGPLRKKARRTYGRPVRTGSAGEDGHVSLPGEGGAGR